MSASIYIDWGALVSAIVDFLLVAFILFLVIKAMNAAKEMTNADANMEKIIKFKKANGKSLSKKEEAYLSKKDEAIKAAEEAARKAEEDSKKLSTTDTLLTEIKELLEKKK